MTFSIVARSADGSAWGVAVASKFLAAGAVVPAARAGLGAFATQSFVNLRYVPDGFALLEQAVPAAEVLRRLTEADELSASRQVGVVDRDGGAAAFTGQECIAWAGSASGRDYAVQGNCLAGPEVVAAMEQAFLAADRAQPLARRLLAALGAGDSAGGDRRGRQSAALYVVTPGGGYAGGNDVLVDLRVDDAPAPLPELERLLDLHDLYFGKPDPATLLPLEGVLAEEVRARLAALGYGGEDLSEVLFDWMGWENYEERHVPGSIDPVVLAALRALPA
ncbi:MAG: DUF1028 domain-containing protein [Actinomycetota bacterium]|nr:DUF1028 domain-containing protein [Actinomycetota bacterium]